MFQKYTKAALAAMMAISMVPVAAYATGDSGNNGPSYSAIGIDAETGTQALTGPLFPNTLTAPPASNTLTGLGSAKDLLAGGILIGAGGNLYFLREASFENSLGDKCSGYLTLEKYDIKAGTWKQLVSLPSYMEMVSAAVYGANDVQGGMIVVTGTLMDTMGGVPTAALSPVANTYIFDPNAETPQWVQVTTDDVPIGASVVNNGGQLQLVGGLVAGAPSTQVLNYEPFGNVKEPAGNLSSPVIAAKVVPHNGALNIYSYGSTLADVQAGTGTPSFQVYENGTSTAYASAIPAMSEPLDMSVYPSQRSVMSGALTSSDSGIVFVGPTASTFSTDIFTSEWGANSFAAYSETASAQQFSGASATVYLGQLYALGSCLDSTGATELVFRSTAMADASLLEGENAPWRKGSTDGLTFTFSPDYGRFKQTVKVDGNTLTPGENYTSMSGSTVINVAASYLETLDEGSHQLTAVFDDGFTEVTANFTVDASEETQGPGFTEPEAVQEGETAKAKTFDALPLAPVALSAGIAGPVALLASRYGRREEEEERYERVGFHGENGEDEAL